MYFRSLIMMFWIDWNMFETFSTPLGRENRICIASFLQNFQKFRHCSLSPKSPYVYLRSRAFVPKGGVARVAKSGNSRNSSGRLIWLRNCNRSFCKKRLAQSTVLIKSFKIKNTTNSNSFRARRTRPKTHWSVFPIEIPIVKPCRTWCFSQILEHVLDFDELVLQSSEGVRS